MTQRSNESIGRTEYGALTVPVRVKVRVDRQIRELIIENNVLIFENVEETKKGRDSPQSPSPRKSSNRHYLQIPMAEIVAVKYADAKSGKGVKYSRCCKPNTDGDDRRDLLASDIALLNQASSNQPRRKSITSSQTADGEQEADTIIVYFIRRRREHLWRLGKITCKFTPTVVGLGCDNSSVEAAIMATNTFELIKDKIAGFWRPKRLLVFINPFGGKKKAVQLYNESAAPVFLLCDIKTTLVVTERANHAEEYVLDCDLSLFDGIVIAGGDGLFNEVLNGLVTRKQREFNIDMNDRKVELAKPMIPVGLISAGSTNALAHTVHGTDDILTSALHIVIGDQRGIDVCGVYDNERLLRFASTAVSYGFLGDLLKNSERLRRFGPPRYFLAAIKVWFKNKHYGGTIRYRTPFGSRDDGNANNMNLKPCRSICDLCTEGDAAVAVAESATVDQRKPESLVIPADGKDSTWALTDDFAHIVGVVTSCVCKLAPDGLSPYCHLGDGYMHVALVSRVGRFQNLAVIGKIMSKNTDHTRHRKFRLFVVKEFSFTPKSAMKPALKRSNSDTSNPAKKANESGRKRSYSGPTSSATASITLAPSNENCGSWNMDGELVAQPKGTIYFRVHRQLITLFARGIETPSSPSLSG